MTTVHASTPTTSYPTSGVPQGTGTGVIVTYNPDITWRDGSIMTWTTGDPIEWIDDVETTPDLLVSGSVPKTAFTGTGDA
jgi:hypothetical protein